MRKMSGAPDDIFHKIRKCDWYRTAALVSPAKAREVDKMGFKGLPLHLALGNRQLVPEDIVNDLIEAYPESCKYKDEAGKLPLHYAAEFNSCSEAVFQAILEANPDAAMEPNKWGQLPIHYACWRRATPSIISMLYDAYPQGATMRDTLAGFACDAHTLRDSLSAEKFASTGLLQEFDEEA